MAARKTKKTRKKTQYVKNRKRKGADSSVLVKRTAAIAVLLLFAGFILFGIFKGFQWTKQKLFSDNPRFNIQQLVISIDGSRVTEAIVRDRSGLYEGRNLFSFTFDEMKKNLEADPNIKSVNLERELPSTLLINVVERIPIARINLQSSGMFNPIDADGVVLPYTRNSVLALLPVVEGLGTNWKPRDTIDHHDLEHVVKILSLCERLSYLHQFIHIESLNVDHNDYVEIRLTEGPEVRMPRHSHEAKLYKLASAIDLYIGSGKSLSEAGKIDLTPDTDSVPLLPR